MQKVLSSLFVLSGLFLAFSVGVAHADGPTMQDMYSKMGFSWGGGSGSGSHWQGNGNSNPQFQYKKFGSNGQNDQPGGSGQNDQSGGSGQQTGDSGGGSQNCPHSGGGFDGSQQPHSWQQGSAGTIRGGLDLPPPSDSAPPPTTPGV